MSARTSPVSLQRDQRGLSTVEYTVLLVLILAGAISLWREIGGDVHARLKDSSKQFKLVTVQGGGAGAGTP